MRSVYHRACSYAFKLNKLLYKDLVHTTWVAHYNRKQEDLFERNIYYVLKAIKLNYWRYIRTLHYCKDNEMYRREWVELSDNYEDHGYVYHHHSTPDRMLMSDQFVNNFYNKLNNYGQNLPAPTRGSHQYIKPQVLTKVLDMLWQGYKQKEIADDMGISPQLVNIYKGKLMSIANQVLE